MLVFFVLHRKIETFEGALLFITTYGQVLQKLNGFCKTCQSKLNNNYSSVITFKPHQSRQEVTEYPTLTAVNA